MFKQLGNLWKLSNNMDKCIFLFTLLYNLAVSIKKMVGKKCFVMSLLFYHYEHVSVKITQFMEILYILKSLSGLATVAKKAELSKGSVV